MSSKDDRKELDKVREDVNFLVECDLVLETVERCSIKYWLERSEHE